MATSEPKTSGEDECALEMKEATELKEHIVVEAQLITECVDEDTTSVICVDAQNLVEHFATKGFVEAMRHRHLRHIRDQATRVGGVLRLPRFWWFLVLH